MYLTNKQFRYNLVLSIIMSISLGLLINFIYGRAIIFKEFFPTLLYWIGFLFIFYIASPRIVTKFVRS